MQRTESPVASLATEARCLSALAATGLVPRMVMAGDGYLATAHVDGRPAGLADIGVVLAALRRQQGSGADVPGHAYGPASVFSKECDVAACLEAAADRSLEPMPRELKELVAVVLSRCRDRGIPDQVVVHGSLDADNVVVAGHGPVFFDLEACRRGPREVDLGALLLGLLCPPGQFADSTPVHAAIGAVLRAGDPHLLVAHAVLRLVFRFQHALPTDHRAVLLMRTLSDGVSCRGVWP